jgi:hypothetical protein
MNDNTSDKMFEALHNRRLKLQRIKAQKGGLAKAEAMRNVKITLPKAPWEPMEMTNE